MKILMPLAEGFEETEAVTTIDLFRRAGLEVVTAGIPATRIKSAHGIEISADTRLDGLNLDEFDALVLVGGYPGYVNLGKSTNVMNAIKKFDQGNKLIAAICASPCILAKAGVLDSKKATIYPGMEREIPRPRANRVVVDGNVITSQGPGTSAEFALAIIEKAKGKSFAEDLRKEFIC